MPPKDADGMVNSADPDQVAELLRSSLIWVNTVCANLSEIFPTINEVPLRIGFHYHPTIIILK